MSSAKCAIQKLTVQEVSTTGQLGLKFLLFLYSKLAEDFLKGAFIKSLEKNEKVLVVFQSMQPNKLPNVDRQSSICSISDF